MRKWHKPVWLYVQEVHMCRGHTGGWKSTYIQKYLNYTAAEEQNYLLVSEWRKKAEKGRMGIYGVLRNCNEE